MAYNRERHKQLVIRSQNLKNQGKNLFLENSEEDSELSKYMIRFTVSDFIRFIGADHKSHYQRKKVLQIFEDLKAFQIFQIQTLTFQDFDDYEFCSTIIISYLKVKKKGRLWTVNIVIAKQLYEYKFLFQMNEYFLTWKNIYQFQVKTQIIEVIAKNSLKKEFYIQEFLKRFNLSNKK